MKGWFKDYENEDVPYRPYGVCVSFDTDFQLWW